MTIKFFKAAAVSSALIASVMGANAAQAATASADVTATILQQVNVTKSSDLNFGTIVTGAAASTVGVSSAGAQSCGTGLVCSGTTTAAGFSVAGTTGQTVTIDADATATLTSGSNTMTATLTESAATLLISSTAASNVFTVGGSLAVGANQADGVYSGSFNVNVVYQ